MTHPEDPRFDAHGLLRPETIDAGHERRAAGPNYGLWLIYLYARPRLFFRHFVQDHLPALTALTAWLYGMTGATDRLERAVSQGTIPGLANSWAVYWAVLAGAGVLSALLYFHLGGWWYRIRLRWSGVPDADKALARRVYLYASLVYALPSVLMIVWQTATFGRPVDAQNSATFSVFDIVILLCLVWSIVTSYIGVRTVFDARGFKPALWFLILPMLLVIAALGVGAAIAITNMSLGARPPAISQPIEFRSGDIVLSHPSNWGVDTLDPEYRPGEYIPITMEADASLVIQVYESEMTSDEEADLSIESVVADASNAENTSIQKFDRWGSHEGAGREVTVTIDGLEITVRCFVTTWGEGRRLEVIESCRAEDRTILDRGFAHVESSFRREPANPALPTPVPGER